jgi:V-type H+-transporting ATPase subunit C
VESVLRYGPPANFAGIVIQPDPKTTKRLVTTLQSQFTYLAPRSKGSKSKDTGATSSTGDDYGGEYAALMEEEIFDFVLVEVPRVVS